MPLNVPREAMLATLGSEPQVVTITLDRLLREFPIQEVVLVYTSATPVRRGLKLLEAEFASKRYAGIRLRTVPVEGPEGVLEDIRTAEDVRWLLRTLYQTVRDLKRAGAVLHLCIAGGRKVMGVAGMVVAQLLCGPDDRAWHLLTEGWTPGRERRMPLDPDEPVWLIPVPILRWTDSAAMLAALAELDDPHEAIRRYEEIVRGERMRRRREFVTRWLTRAEREVARLACAGLDNAAIARKLRRSERTVAHHLTRIYEKLQDWMGLPGMAVGRSVLLAELVPYFTLQGEGTPGRGDYVPEKVGISSDAHRNRGR